MQFTYYRGREYTRTIAIYLPTNTTPENIENEEQEKNETRRSSVNEISRKKA